jgi:hypothetical protein
MSATNTPTTEAASMAAIAKRVVTPFIAKSPQNSLFAHRAALVFLHHLRQLGDIRRDPPRLVA